MGLKFVGDETWRASVLAAEKNGGRILERPSLPGVPARDLNDDEVKEFGKEALLKSGLYAEERAPRKAPVSFDSMGSPRPASKEGE